MLTLQDAKNRFSAVVEAAINGTPQKVSRRGKPAVVVISVEEYARLKQGEAQPKPSFKDHLRAMPDGPEDFEFDRTPEPLRDIEF
ncbi:type II toxin-antitoxin system Phd/YefM family antitoxin [Shimia ponticola]|uniref:type II toxin-antitoxin system Phd/YefM family antitoxin n=1 Tax=Shimia ponticola TaxID=2582893 RepID=UPI0011BD4808|nr:type II toxin-antitoxin system Phd/YefM family antitoxin [Shimia ponticola]